MLISPTQVVAQDGRGLAALLHAHSLPSMLIYVFCSISVLI